MLRHSYGPAVWAFPGGGIDKGEEPREAALREVREELGLALDAVEPLGTLQEEISGSPHTAFLFTATTNKTPQPDGREITEARFFPRDALPEPLGRVTSGRIDFWRGQSAP